MGKFGTKYCAFWEIDNPWLTFVKNDKSQAKCKLCTCDFKVSNGGISSVQAHARTKKHVANSEAQVNQRIFQKSGNSNYELSRGSFILTEQEKILKAEILWVLKCTKNNFSFSSNNENNELFVQMFPDSAIAQNYKMSETKAKYLLEFGIFEYVKQKFLEDFNRKPFCFKFDETTTVQTKKQFDGYVQYWSCTHNKIINRYCGSLFLGHCTSEEMKEHFYDFGKKLNWDVNYLLQIGMDGPNVNLAFLRILEQDLKVVQNNKLIINIGTCNLHPIHNGFMKGLKKIHFDYDGFAHDLAFFFKFSSARREDFKLMSLVTEIEAQFMLRHVNSRWLSLKKVLTRIMDQWKNLQEYFLKFLPKQKNIVREIASTERYIRIKKILVNDISKIYLAFAVFLADMLEIFIVSFQSDTPMIHNLYPALGTLFRGLMKNFVKSSLLKENDGTKKNADALGLINLNEKNNLINIHNMEIGTAARYVCATNEDHKDLQAIKNQFQMCYVELTTYLQNHLPHDSTMVKDLQYLHPKRILSRKAIGSFRRLSVKFCSVLNNTTYIGSSSDRFTDSVVSQLQLLQMEKFDDAAMMQIDKFWDHVASVKNSLTSCFKFNELAKLALTCLCLSIGNAVPERGFSFNKDILKGRELLKENTIEALRMVKDETYFYKNVSLYPITSALLKLCLNSKRKYEIALQKEKDMKTANQNEAKKRKLEEEKRDEIILKQQKKREELDLIKMNITNVKAKLKVAERLSEDCNKKFALTLNSKNLKINKTELHEIQAGLAIGLEKSKVLNNELKELLELEKNTLKETE